MRRAEIRPVEIRGEKRIQIVRHAAELRTDNYLPLAAGDGGAEDLELARAVDELLALPFGNWHVETTQVTYQLRVTKKGKAQVHRGPAAQAVADTSHDRAKKQDRKSTRLNSSHVAISYAVFCLKKK